MGEDIVKVSRHRYAHVFERCEERAPGERLDAFIGHESTSGCEIGVPVASRVASA